MSNIEVEKSEEKPPTEKVASSTPETTGDPISAPNNISEENQTNNPTTEETITIDEREIFNDEEEVEREEEEELFAGVWWPFKKLLQFGNYLGEKIAWGMGITASRYHDTIWEAEDMRRDLREKIDEENPAYPVKDGLPDFNEIPEEQDLVDHFYYKSIDPKLMDNDVEGSYAKPIVEEEEKELEPIEIEEEGEVDHKKGDGIVYE